MLPIRKRSAVAPLLAAAVLAGCGSSNKSDSGSSSNNSESSPSSTSVAAGSTVPASELSDRMTKAAKGAKTYHLDSKTKTMGMTITSALDVQVDAAGKQDVRGVTHAGPATTNLISLDNGAKVWIKSAALKLSDWTPVSASSSNPVVKQMAKNMAEMKQSMDAGAILQLLGKAGKFTARDHTQVNGVSTTPYTGALPASAIPATGGERPSKDVPVTMYVDDQNRLIRLKETVAVESTTSTATMDFQQVRPAVEHHRPEVIRGVRALDIRTG